MSSTFILILISPFSQNICTSKIFVVLKQLCTPEYAWETHIKNLKCLAGLEYTLGCYLSQYQDDYFFGRGSL